VYSATPRAGPFNQENRNRKDLSYELHVFGAGRIRREQTLGAKFAEGGILEEEVIRYHSFLHPLDLNAWAGSLRLPRVSRKKVRGLRGGGRPVHNDKGEILAP